ncbi:MAG TPA: alpha/beta hydrolase [Synechococcales bacterium UBA10510]|nr:alpha/beta hydrolase [Synechococcales bacterium UBA10510]
MEAPTAVSRLIDGPAEAPATLLFAHGAGAPMDSPFMAAIAGGLAAKGWRVVRFEFPYMALMREKGSRQGPDRLPVLQEAFREQVRVERASWPQRPLFIGGKSLGGRVASLLIDELAASPGVQGCLCFGYPFHPPGKPLTLRTEHLAALQSPTLILQGERDTLGKRQEVESYALSAQVQLQWIPSGDHSFKPIKSSGLSEAENWATAVAYGDQFIRQLISP